MVYKAGRFGRQSKRQAENLSKTFEKWLMEHPWNPRKSRSAIEKREEE